MACMQWDYAFLEQKISVLSSLDKWKVQFACECVANKNILYLEDPTVGLEEDIALHLLATLREFALEGRIIILTLDNITQRHLDILTRTQVISNNGAIYFGPTKPFNEFISKLGFSMNNGSSYSYFLDSFFQSSQQFKHNITINQLENGNNFTTEDLDVARAQISTFTKPEKSKVIWRYGNDKTGNGPFFIITFLICLWRASMTRIRDVDQVSTIWIQGGIITGCGLLFTFYGQELDINGFQDRCAFLSVAPFGTIVLSNLWYTSDHYDRLQYIYERRKHYNHTIIFPIANLLADVIILRIFPSVIACIIVYDGVGLNPKWSSKFNYVYTMLLMMITASLFSRLSTCINLNYAGKEGRTKSAITFASLMCVMVMYAGFLLNLSTLPESKEFVRNWSIYYWGCNNLYYGENDDQYYEIATVVGNDTFNPLRSTIIYVKDLPKVCKIAKPWCDYCNNSFYDRDIIHLNYTCKFSQVTDLCVKSSPIYNTTLCDGINNGTQTVEIPGDLLLEGFGIEEIGREKVYQVLWSHAAVYFGLACIFMYLLNRTWSKKELKDLRNYLGFK
jgi:hypothetical protein